MICKAVKDNYKMCKADYQGRWVAKIILFNIDDVDTFTVSGRSVDFSLKNEKAGITYEYNDVNSVVDAYYSTVDEGAYQHYLHVVKLPLSGLAYDAEPLHNGEYFAALMNDKDEVWVFGFNFGLEALEHDFMSNALNVLELRSTVNEFEMPLQYIPDSGNAKNKFANNSF